MTWNTQRLFFTAMALACLALIGGILVSPARADNLGCHITAMVGMTSTNTKTSVDASWGENFASVNGLGQTGTAEGLGAGCDWTVDRFVVGAFGDYVFHQSQFDGTAFGSSVSMKLTRQMTLGGRAGFLVGPADGGTLIYALAGWTKLGTDGITGAINVGVPDFTGIVLGGGIETPVSKHVKIGVEYRHVAFDPQTVALASMGSDSISGKLSPEMQSVLLRLSIGTEFFGASLK